MRLTAFTDFGLRALMRIAAEPERSFTTDEIAGELAISRHHLAKIVGDLAGAGIVKTQRGGGGGFRLARAAETISLGDIVRLLEGGQPLVECFRPDGGACMLSPRCRLKGHLAAANEAFLAELDKTPLADCRTPPPKRGGRRMRGSVR